jgi:hypothetical protein
MLFHSLKRKASLGSIVQNAERTTGRRTQRRKLAANPVQTSVDVTLSLITLPQRKDSAFLR